METKQQAGPTMADWSNNVLVAFGREYDFSIKSNFEVAFSRLKGKKSLQVEVSHREGYESLNFIADEVAGSWTIRSSMATVSLGRLGSQWPVRLKAFAVYMWVLVNEHPL